eukprot:Cvel_17287.t2-p1 / transcript=Cvel_17287.t2 / gene=Cvel_17287 / organism=Chromera_velia_CCMP2878 / gene_product=Probable bifunctional, putative / transcript_product=Probable bifunctional, putative / location=Cvel_scaffold1372:776-1732(+) / protein_length=319 / sequence_SO=supercontig / SO=protein_coding / is_pseudo=false
MTSEEKPLARPLVEADTAEDESKAIKVHKKSEDGHEKEVEKETSIVRVKDCSAIVVDIEGTTTSISFVAETLFPYAKEKVEAFISETFDTPETKEDIRALSKLRAEDVEQNLSPPPFPSLPEEGDGKSLAPEAKAEVVQGVAAYVKWLIGADRKVSPLKSLQGRIWETGYKKGDLVGHVYEEVPGRLKTWITQPVGKPADDSEKDKALVKLYVYSSGSVLAQKLLFGHTSHGDLLPLFSGHFDTKHPGSKLEWKSYETIAKDVGLPPSRIVFLTDNINEAKAAVECGMQVVVSIRPGTAELPEGHGFPCVHSFDQVLLE